MPPLTGSLRMVRYLARADRPELIADRLAHFADHRPRQFRVVERTGVALGWVAFWDRQWIGEPAVEIGWARMPGAEGHDLAHAVEAVVARAAAERGPTWLIATPSADDESANAICTKTGFGLVDTRELDLPDGSRVACRVWQQRLVALSTG